MVRAPEVDESLAGAGSPANAAVHGHALIKSGETKAALTAFQTAVQTWPDNPELHNGYGVAQAALGDYAGAARSFERVVEIDPALAMGWYNHGRACLAMGDPGRAIESLNQALQRHPRSLNTLRTLGNALQMCGRHEEAVSFLRRALALSDVDGQLHAELARSLVATDNLAEAIAELTRATAIKDDPENLCLLGDLHQANGSLASALDAYSRGIAAAGPQSPSSAPLGTLLFRRATLLTGTGDFGSSAVDVRRLMELDPSYPYAAGLETYLALMECRWEGLEVRIEHALQRARRDESALPPWIVIATEDDPEAQLRAARTWARTTCPGSTDPMRVAKRRQQGRLRVAYLSSDFGDHPVARALSGIVAHHDRNGFEIIGVSLTPVPANGTHAPASTDPVWVPPATDRLARGESGFDELMDASRLADWQVAQTLRDRQVDIAIDLNGYTACGRPNILAARCASIQINFLGYPGTMGAPFMDYVLADRITLPPENAGFFTERIAYVEGCVLPASGSWPGTQIPTRQELALPSEAVVLAAFHTSYKITPRMFAVWMRILQRAPQSVLWLSVANEAARGRLRASSQAAGVDPARLIFATRVPRAEDHIARLTQADLFLDTLPYNAHTSAADALRAGVPVLTCMGRSFAARVGASLLTALDMPELIARSLIEYEQTAVELAADPVRSRALRDRLETRRRSAQLFDARAYCSSLESVLQAIAAGHPPSQY